MSTFKVDESSQEERRWGFAFDRVPFVPANDLLSDEEVATIALALLTLLPEPPRPATGWERIARYEGIERRQ